MTFNPAKHHRHSNRLHNYDYTRPGYYFVTLCVRDRECLFGEIVNGKMQLHEFGAIVVEKWKWLSDQFPYVQLDEFIVMPNHIHGILWIRDISCRGGSRPAPTMGNMPSESSRHTPERRKTIGQLIGAFKTVSAKKKSILFVLCKALLCGNVISMII